MTILNAVRDFVGNNDDHYDDSSGSWASREGLGCRNCDITNRNWNHGRRGSYDDSNEAYIYPEDQYADSFEQDLHQDYYSRRAESYYQDPYRNQDPYYQDSYYNNYRPNPYNNPYNRYNNPYNRYNNPYGNPFMSFMPNNNSSFGGQFLSGLGMAAMSQLMFRGSGMMMMPMYYGFGGMAGGLVGNLIMSRMFR
ncbi:MAG: hypothetical protein K2W82_06255 [Candidatus Obscuribacterales bacterium]|nr:hypothetical protein [Candidatus Obscuribacterales bacterium]